MVNRTQGKARPATVANEWLVRRIRQNKYGWPRWYWAELTGLSLTTIEKIATYKSWRHVGAEDYGKRRNPGI